MSNRKKKAKKEFVIEEITIMVMLMLMTKVKGVTLAKGKSSDK